MLTNNPGVEGGYGLERVNGEERDICNIPTINIFNKKKLTNTYLPQEGNSVAKGRLRRVMYFSF